MAEIGMEVEMAEGEEVLVTVAIVAMMTGVEVGAEGEVEGAVEELDVKNVTGLRMDRFATIQSSSADGPSKFREALVRDERYQGQKLV